VPPTVQLVRLGSDETDTASRPTPSTGGPVPTAKCVAADLPLCLVMVTETVTWVPDHPRAATTLWAPFRAPGLRLDRVVGVAVFTYLSHAPLCDLLVEVELRQQSYVSSGQ
jgi:hypothetical protein